MPWFQELAHLAYIIKLLGINIQNFCGLFECLFCIWQKL